MTLKRWRYYIGITLVLITIMVVAGKMKAGYHVDEMFTFELANQSIERHLQIVDGTPYDGK